MIRVLIAIDDRLYYQADVKADDVELSVLTLVVEIAGSLWSRAEWYTADEAGVINKETSWNAVIL